MTFFQNSQLICIASVSIGYILGYFSKSYIDNISIVHLYITTTCSHKKKKTDSKSYNLECRDQFSQTD